MVIFDVLIFVSEKENYDREPFCWVTRYLTALFRDKNFPQLRMDNYVFSGTPSKCKRHSWLRSWYVLESFGKGSGERSICTQESFQQQRWVQLLELCLLEGDGFITECKPLPSLWKAFSCFSSVFLKTWVEPRKTTQDDSQNDPEQNPLFCSSFLFFPFGHDGGAQQNWDARTKLSLEKWSHTSFHSQQFGVSLIEADC